MTPASRLWLCVGLAGGVMLSVACTILAPTGPGLGLTAFSALFAMGIATAAWQYMPRFERVDTSQPGADGAPGHVNNRFQLRVLAWREMKVLVTPQGRTGQTALLVNISLSGLAVSWTAEPVPVGSRIRFDIAGYAPGEGVVVSCGRDTLRLRFTGAISMLDTKRMRNDCLKGRWSGNLTAPTPVLKR